MTDNSKMIIFFLKSKCQLQKNFSRIKSIKLFNVFIYIYLDTNSILLYETHMKYIQEDESFVVFLKEFFIQKLYLAMT